jgi:biotin-dependent carboxylase-like uncharacterized protein
MGSSSTDLAGRFGGHEGRHLRPGDVLRFGAGAHGAVRKLRPGALDSMMSGNIRLTRGVQWDWFDADAVARFLEAEYIVTEQSNRAGLRLKGPAIKLKESTQLLTEGVALGAVQIPPDGQPIILFVDQQTTGGYPKIANAIAADLHRIGQLRPRDKIRFELVSIERAVELLRKQEEQLRGAFEE